MKGRYVGEAASGLRLYLQFDLVERVGRREKVLFGETPADGEQIGAGICHRVLVYANEAYIIRRFHVLFQLQNRQVVFEC